MFPGNFLFVPVQRRPLDRQHEEGLARRGEDLAHDLDLRQEVEDVR